MLRALSEKVSKRLEKAGIAGRTVVLKLKNQDFNIKMHNRQLTDLTQLADHIFQTGMQLLSKETDGTKYRLLSIGINDLSDDECDDTSDIVDVQSHKRTLVESAIGVLRGEFSKKAFETD